MVSNYLAVAAVTETLRHALASAIGPVLGGATVTTGRPGAPTTAATPPRVNVFLYQVTPNPHWRNDDVPTRAADGRLLKRPRAALDLHYLITFSGEDATQDSQQLLGIVVRTLHAQPVLTAGMVAAATTAAGGWMNPADLAREVELVRLTPLALSLDDLSRLWTVFPDVQYELSLAYVASVVFIEAEAPPPAAVLPVLDRNVYVVTGRTPAITQVAPGEGPGWPIGPGSLLTVTGQRLLGPDPAATKVLIDGADVASTPADAARTALHVGDAQVTLRIAASLPAAVPGWPLTVGPHRLQVQQPIAMGRPQAPHPGFESNVVAFLFQPRLLLADAAPAAARVTFSLDPPLEAGQVATLSLVSRKDATTAEFAITPPPVAGEKPPPPPPNPISVDVPGLAAGDWLVRVTVDGVVTPLTRDANPASPTFGLWSGPTVTLP